MGFTGLYLVSPGFYGISLSFTDFYRVVWDHFRILIRGQLLGLTRFFFVF